MRKSFEPDEQATLIAVMAKAVARGCDESPMHGVYLRNLGHPWLPRVGAVAHYEHGYLLKLPEEQTVLLELSAVAERLIAEHFTPASLDVVRMSAGSDPDELVNNLRGGLVKRPAKPDDMPEFLTAWLMAALNHDPASRYLQKHHLAIFPGEHRFHFVLASGATYEVSVRRVAPAQEGDLP